MTNLIDSRILTHFDSSNKKANKKDNRYDKKANKIKRLIKRRVDGIECYNFIPSEFFKSHEC